MTPTTAHGDAEAAFTDVFTAHQPTVYAYLLGRVGDPETARDLLQETFLRVWRRIDELVALPPSRQRAWIYTVGRNLVTDTYRSRALRAATVQALADSSSPSAPAPETTVATAAWVDEVTTAVRELPEELRVVLTMHAVGDLTSTEIGEILGLPPGTVRYRLSLARRRLAAVLGPHDPLTGETHGEP